MATKMREMGFVLLLAFILCNGATAQSSCSSTLMSLSSCINYVTGNMSTPSSSCCSSLASIVQSQPRCLCPLLNGGGSTFGITINQTLALALPAACNVVTPPVSRCNAPAPSTHGSDGPAETPTNSSDEPAETPTTTTVQSTPSGSKTAPGTGGSTSSGSSITTSIQLTAFALSVAVWIVKF